MLSPSHCILFCLFIFAGASCQRPFSSFFKWPISSIIVCSIPVLFSSSKAALSSPLIVLGDELLVLSVLSPISTSERSAADEEEGGAAFRLSANFVSRLRACEERVETNVFVLSTFVLSGKPKKRQI
jgi:hypothetical protein